MFRPGTKITIVPVMRKLALLLLFVAAPVLLANDADVERIRERYRQALPSKEDLRVYELDWAANFSAARKRARTEKRPILLIVVRNSYGNIYTGHC